MCRHVKLPGSCGSSRDTSRALGSITMEEDERALRAHSLMLLKKKLHRTRPRRPAAINISKSLVDNDLDNQVAHDECVSHDDVVVPALKDDIVVKHAPVKDPRAVAAAPPAKLTRTLKKLVVTWSCTKCQRECIPVREESRCLCGHRYKEHPSTADDPRVVKASSVFKPFACTVAKCACPKFFYVVAEGAWILRCRCKHKHIDHDAGGAPFKCKKPKCKCDGFDSPWVCNCNHAWGDHVQATVEKEFKPLDLLHAQFEVEELNRVQRTDLFAEPLNL